MIRLESLRYEVAAFSLEVSLEIARGEYFVLMGPPGAGKSVMVECLAGLRAPSAGRISVAGRDVTDAEPRDRGVGYVPQDYALFTTRSVRDNIAFGPQIRGLPSGEADRRVREAAVLLGIEHLLERPRVQGLSGGERQRVALARALAVRPHVLILDEPVSALDESTRESVCAELRRLQRELGLTTIHISHNLEEAFSVADRGAVMSGGRIRQVGPLGELLRRPAGEFVARFMRCENIFLGACRGAGRMPATTLAEASGAQFLLPGERRGQVQFAIRPENLIVELPGDRRERTGAAAVPARLARAVDRGAYVRLELDGPARLVAHLSPRAFADLGAAEGAELVAVIPPEAVHVIPG